MSSAKSAPKAKSVWVATSRNPGLEGEMETSRDTHSAHLPSRIKSKVKNKKDI